jgi:hypothetical protein
MPSNSEPKIKQFLLRLIMRMFQISALDEKIATENVHESSGLDDDSAAGKEGTK